METLQHSAAGTVLSGWRAQVEEWCAGRSALVRAPLLLWLAYVGIRHVADPLYTSLFGALNLGLHEGGHLLFGYLRGEFLAVAGGTVLQLAAPGMAAVMFLRQPDYFAITVCGAWLATNLYNVAAYMADARVQELPLVTVGDGECVICHDWAYMLGRVGLLSLDTTLAGLVRVVAFILMWSSLAAGGWMLWRMTRNENGRLPSP
jgi:hypothetical protein